MFNFPYSSIQLHFFLSLGLGRHINVFPPVWYIIWDTTKYEGD